MIYSIYYSPDRRIDLFIVDQIDGWDDEQIEFVQVHFKGILYLQKNNWTGFISEKEDFFAFAPDGGFNPQLHHHYFTLNKEFENVLYQIIDNMPETNFRESVRALMSIKDEIL